MYIKKILEPNFGENMYILVDEETKKCAVVDPGGAVDKIFDYINSNDLTFEYILLTHGHGDHIGAVNAIKEKTNVSIDSLPQSVQEKIQQGMLMDNIDDAYSRLEEICS